MLKGVPDMLRKVLWLSLKGLSFACLGAILYALFCFKDL